MQELIDHDYVKGFKYVRAWGGDLVIIDTEPRITLEGIAFLKENSGMQKALKFLQESKSALPFLEPFI